LIPLSGIDAAVFDLKAVNPNAVVKIDARTPEEVIQSIEKQNEVVRNSLQNLRCLLQQGVAI
jgi:type I restriction enzyme M protein